MNTKEFIIKAQKIHGDKYDYSKVNYANPTTKVCIICPEHGEFWQSPHNHLSNKSGCPKCCKNHNRYTTETIIEKFKEIHGNQYDYSKVVYHDSRTKVCIICPEHGEFWQTPFKHSNGQGCPKCGKKSAAQKNSLKTEEFIEKSESVHNGKYNYSKTEYKNSKEKVCIICPIHGEFWQNPHHHLGGHGCPKCNYSRMEREIYTLLEEIGIKFISQYNDKWLGRQKLDFYLPEIQTAIECQGEQHFHEVEYRSKKWTKEKSKAFLKENQERDITKLEKCSKNGVEIIYYSDIGLVFPYEVIRDKKELASIIKNKLGK